MDITDSILVTGGAGFIGSNFVINWLSQSLGKVINLDLLTYAGNKNNLASVATNKNHIFVHGNIADSKLVTELLEEFRPRAIINFAAESHVDRSIANPNDFINTNINGTYNLLECARKYWLTLEKDDKDRFRFLHISTDEVYGSLELDDPAFTEATPYQPNSPYSASKAASDHLVRAWYHTYGLPTLITNCSNNYGPFQYPEKLIPLTILNALKGKELPIYGDGKNIRDWLHVDDHCFAIIEVLHKGKVGECYNIGSNNEKTNIEVVETICKILDKLIPAEQHPEKNAFKSYRELIKFVKDRAGHDRRYAINAEKIKNDLGWRASISFEEGIKQTIEWYLANETWLQEIDK
ncbi:MAG: dTDP-glucose 4,6-dehydratase [Rickettsiaceae bacterium]